MIEEAIKELNEPYGSTFEDISKYIQEHYEKFLPFAHWKILERHLKNLRLNEKLVYTVSGKYMLQVESIEEKEDNKEGIQVMCYSIYSTIYGFCVFLFD